MVVPVEQLSIKSTTAGGTSALGATATKAALGDRLGQIINVKTDFGAVGDGSNDDTANIQAALDAAFGPASSPHGTANSSLNRPVYFPAGIYKTTAPLYLTNVASGWIFGAGSNCTRINFVGNTSGNAVIPNPTLTITASITASTNLVVTAVNVIPSPASDIVNDTLSYNGTVLSGGGVTAGTTLTGAQTVYTPTGTHGTTNGTTTFVDATFNAFTAGMVGHALRITTGGAGIAGLYRIVGFTSSSTVILNGTALAGSGNTWRVEGYTGTYTVSVSQTAAGPTINVAALGSEITPVFMTNGFSYSVFERLNLNRGGGSATNTAGFYYFEDGLQGSSTGNTFNDLVIGGFTTGILAGYQTPGLCSEANYVNVTIGSCVYGIRLASFNALNHNVFGGGAISCTGAGYYAQAGAFNSFTGVSCADNTVDFLLVSQSPCSIIGGRTESKNSIQTTSQLFMSTYQFSGSALTSGGTVVQANGGGTVTMTGCVFSDGGVPYEIVELFGTGIAILDNCVSFGGANGTISGSTGAKVWLRGCIFSNGASTTSGFTGAGGTLVTL